VRWTVESARGREGVDLPRPTAWRSAERVEWARRHVGMVVQIVVFTGGAFVLLLRRNDWTAALSVLALALSAVGGGGPLLGVENALPLGMGYVLTVFTWLAGPLAFPVIALAILYFPSRSPRLTRHPSLHSVPFLVAAPMIGRCGPRSKATRTAALPRRWRSGTCSARRWKYKATQRGPNAMASQPAHARVPGWRLI